MGQTVHLATRMEQVAGPGTTVLSAETLGLVEMTFWLPEAEAELAHLV